MCYIFRQIFPFHSELRKDKIATCSLLPPAVFLSPPTFWEARDQPEPGSFFPRMKDPGNEMSDRKTEKRRFHECKQSAATWPVTRKIQQWTSSGQESVIFPSSSQLKQSILGHVLAWWPGLLHLRQMRVWSLCFKRTRYLPKRKKEGTGLDISVPKTRIPLKQYWAWSEACSEEKNLQHRTGLGESWASSATLEGV